MEAVAIKAEPPEVAAQNSTTLSGGVAAVAETTKQPTRNVEIEKSRCGEIFVTNNARKWTFTCTYCDKTTRDIGEFICHIQFKHMNGQYNEDGDADNGDEVVQPKPSQNNAKGNNVNKPPQPQPNVLFQAPIPSTSSERQHSQAFSITPTIATVSSLANSNSAPTFEYSDSTNESDEFTNNVAQNPQPSSFTITNTQSLNRSKRKHDSFPCSTCPKEMVDLQFVKAIEVKGKVLLNKCNTPQVNSKKKDAVEQVRQYLLLNGGDDMKHEQIIKKVANIKQKVKTKSDLKGTGNMPIKLKPSEQMFLDIMRAENNPAITPIKHGLDNGEPSKTLKEEEIIDPGKQINISNTPSCSSTKKIKIVEEDNNIPIMQRDVLSNQLDLIEMEKEMRQHEHREAMELYRLKFENEKTKKEVLFLKKIKLEPNFQDY